VWLVGVRVVGAVGRGSEREVREERLNGEFVMFYVFGKNIGRMLGRGLCC
jgi:hypothetical protein